jgi:hypothetical protein
MEGLVQRPGYYQFRLTSFPAKQYIVETKTISWTAEMCYQEQCHPDDVYSAGLCQCMFSQEPCKCVDPEKSDRCHPTSELIIAYCVIFDWDTYEHEIVKVNMVMKKLIRKDEMETDMINQALTQIL